MKTAVSGRKNDAMEENNKKLVHPSNDLFCVKFSIQIYNMRVQRSKQISDKVYLVNISTNTLTSEFDDQYIKDSLLYALDSGL